MSHPIDMAVVPDWPGRPGTTFGALGVRDLVVFFQAYAIAPMLPELASFFKVEAREAGLAVPAYRSLTGSRHSSLACSLIAWVLARSC